MRKVFGISLTSSLVAAFVAGALLVVPGGFSLTGDAGLAFAQQKKAKPAPVRKTRRIKTLSIQVNRKLEAAQVAVDEKDYTEAFDILSALQRKKINSYESAMVWYFFGFLYYEQDDYPKAIQAYEQVLQEKGLPLNFEDSIRFTVAQLYFAEENYRKSLQLLDEWLIYQENPPVQAFMFKGQAHYALEDYRNAVAPILTAIGMRKAAGVVVRENTYLLLRSLYFELEDLQKVKDILEILILNYPPKADYWLQLSAIHSELREEDSQLATMEVAYKQGFFGKENHYVNLAQLYLYNLVPIKAARVFEDGFGKKVVKENKKNLEIYSQALMLAREFKESIVPLERAAKLSDDGDLYLRLAQVQIEIDDHAAAVKAIQAALKKGDLDRPDQASMLLGTSYFNLDRLQDAINAFRAAAKDKRSRKQANTWIEYLRKEMKRRKQLAAALQPIRRSSR